MEQQKVRTLPGGLRVVTVALPHLHGTTAILYVRVGSRYESPADNGLSHFLEHMLFRGTETHPTSYDLSFAIESLGGTLNAETGRDYSLYEVDLDPDCMQEGLGLLGEIFTTSRFRDIELERRLILEEMNEDFDDDGNDINLSDLTRGLVFADHPLGQKIIGPPENVQRFTAADVRRHFERYHGARNMVLAVAGPIDHDRVGALAERAFAGLAPGELAEPMPPPAARTSPAFRYVDIPGAQTAIQLIFTAPSEMDPDYPALCALVRALDDGMSTPLHYTLCDQLGLAYYVSASIEPFHDTGLFELEGATSHDQTPELARRMLELCARFRDDLVSPGEMTKLRRRYRRDVHSTLDDAPGMAGWFGGTRLFHEPLTVAEKLARIDAVTAEDIRRVARRVFRPETLVAAAGGGLTRPQRTALDHTLTTWC